MKNDENHILNEVYHKLIVVSFDIDERVDHPTLKEGVVEILEMIENEKILRSIPKDDV